ncbi:MAG TPA: protein kinase [Ktedonobacterales bacterium]|nr:protein kinase [Ktedonobacterales bacterium]
MPQSTSQATLAPGTLLLKRFRILELIGSGGYACVYRATDLTFGYDRAIKEVSDPDKGVRDQFRLEAELLINSRHPNIPHGYHLIEDMGRLFLVMDFVEGKDLEELLNESLTQRARPLEEAQALRWAIEICSALDEMHSRPVPVIHRDIKPANIKITPEDRPILIDFGLAKLHHKSNPTMTAAQGVSPGFAPPEQYMAKGRTDARTDIYGLGATLYASLTGKDPPEAPSRLLAQTGATLGATLSPLRRLNGRVSEETERLIMRALELSPNNRQQSARQLQREIQTSLEHLTGAKPAEPTLNMGEVCPRCGTQNRPGALRCVQCDRPLTGQSPSPRYGSAGPAPMDGTGKRAALAGPLAGRTNGRMPAQPAPRPAYSPEKPVDQRTGRQQAVVNQRSGKQPAVAIDPRTGKQQAVAADAMARMGTGAMPAARPGPQAQMPERSALAPNGARDRLTAVLPESSGEKGWIHLGDVALSGFGKVMLTLSAIEVLWGAFVLVLGAVEIANHGRTPPWLQLIGGWLVVVALGSVLGAQAINRPVHRRGKLTPVRRWLQGIFLALYTLAVHGVAVWGATIFANGQSDSTAAVLAFILFGVNVLVVGILAVVNTLG